MTQLADTPRRSLRERRKNLFTLLTCVFALLYLASVFADVFVDANLFWLSAAIVVAMTASTFGWGRTLDEAQLKAHYQAWFWGGSVGLMVSSLIFLALLPTMMSSGSAALGDDIADVATTSFTAGFVLAILPATLGYLVWWAVLWMRNR